MHGDVATPYCYRSHIGLLRLKISLSAILISGSRVNFCRKDRLYNNALLLVIIISMVIHMHGDVKAAIALSDSDDCSGAHMGLDAPLHGFQESVMDSL